MAVRKKLKLSPSQMAGRLRVTPSSYYKAERGEQFFGLVTLKRFSDEFDVSIDWLLYDRGPQYITDKTKIAEMEEINREMKLSYEAQIETLNKTIVNEKQKSSTTGGRYNPANNEDVNELLEYFETDSAFFYEMMMFFKKHKKENQPAG